MTIAAGQTASASDVNAIKDDVDAIISTASSIVATSETTSSTSFGNLATSGPSVTLTTGTAALVILSASVSNSTVGQSCRMGFEVTGASSVSPSTGRCLLFESSSANQVLRADFTYHLESLTAGSNTFTAKYSVSGGTGTFATRSLIVIPLGN